MTSQGMASEVRISAADESLSRDVIAALRRVYDPEIPINIFDLGLVYRLEITKTGHVIVHMSLTSPGSHMSYFMPCRVKSAVSAVPRVRGCEVKLVWDPPWTTERVSRDVRREMNIPVANERH